MAKIPFSIKYRPQIESGEYKVVTSQDYPVQILKWDADNLNTPIFFSYMTKIGEYCAQTSGDDLFIITPEPELSEFEIKVREILYADKPEYSACDPESWKRASSELLKLARNEIVKSGYAIVESEHYLEEGRKNYERGKAEALKDLPRWENVKIPATDIAKVWVDALDTFWLQHKNKKIRVQSLEKLPGFEED